MSIHTVSASSLPASDAKGVVRLVVSSAVQYLDARVGIAKLEGREAVREGLWLVIFAVLLIACLALAYAGGMLALAWWVSLQWGASSFMLVIMALTGFHLLLAAGFAASILRAWRRTHFFHATRKEFMEDKRWLEEPQTCRS